MEEEFGDKITWLQGLPKDPYKPFKTTPGMIIIDDLMNEMSEKNNMVATWFTKGTHHRDVTLVVLLQNAYPRNMRTASLNAHYMVLFNNPRDKGQITKLASQAFPGSKERVKTALGELTPFEPLIMDFSQTKILKKRITHFNAYSYHE
jgi:hypothetical protein